MEENRFSYETTLKYKPEDNFFNFQHYLLFTSKQITKLLFKTSVTPHQVILFSLIIGVASSILIIQENKIIVIIGAVMLFYKNIFDKVDGSLARAKGMATRRGRFYDSITDFIVSFTLFTAIGFRLNEAYNSFWVWVLCYLALITSMLQCSFFIYYEVAFIKETGKITINRLLESVTDEDLEKEDKFTLLLQRIFQIIYGWQDYLVYKIDKVCFNALSKKNVNSDSTEIRNLWYKDKPFLSVSSLLCIGTHMFLIAVFAIAGKFEYYLLWNLILWNLLLIYCVFYHYYHINGKLRTPDN